jgi:hypothetical protein
MLVGSSTASKKWSLGLLSFGALLTAGCIPQGPGHGGVDNNSLCQVKPPPSAHRVVVVDRTDPLGDETDLKSTINKIRDRLRTNERLSIWEVERAAAGADPRAPTDQAAFKHFDKCRPRSPDECNELIESCLKIEAELKTFVNDLEDVIKELVHPPAAPAKRTRLVQALHQIITWPAFVDAGERELWLFSDLLEKSATMSCYEPRVVDFKAHLTWDYVKKVEKALAGVRVNVLQKVRPTDAKNCAAFWESYWKHADAKEVIHTTL